MPVSDSPSPSNDNAAQRNNNIQLFIATPCFGGMVTTGYMSSIMMLMQLAQQHGISVGINMLGRDSLITRSRNTLVSHFLSTEEATHLMFIDADIAFDPELVLRMLAFDEDVVGGMYPAKALNWQPSANIVGREPMNTATLQYVGKFCEGDELERRGPFATGVYCATGFMMIKRRVIEQLIEAHPECMYTSDHVYSPGQGGRHYYALFECMIDPETREYLSEDFGFCRMWRNLGGKIWLDVEGSLTHTGPHDFIGMPALRFGASEPEEAAAPISLVANL
ncbi:hypothetical protein [Pseudolabrys sp. FHR47]|uniref:hypothetical protein n=1 Tax=Pseudolabrys sp. FHR47 TaxID=2562284 RepID=UPI001FEF21EA|nr:hypothetical protein [Pseudolabrys sp. FHR47]